jgi:hypothetical protein
MGSIFQRGNVWWIKYYRNGKPYRESTQSIKVSYAKRLLKLREGEVTQGKIPSLRLDKVLFEELAEGALPGAKPENFPIFFPLKVPSGRFVPIQKLVPMKAGQ